MASSSGMQSAVEDEDQEEQFERFDDFTLASSWERFISEVEAVCRQWLADGPKNLLEKGAVRLDSSMSLYLVKFELKYATKSYCMEYYFETNNDGKVADWSCTLHDMQLSFGVKEFLMIAPQSASGVVLDAPEASKLLSAVAIALSNCSSLWPAFVPVHDPSRKAYIGIQNMGTIFTRRFEADRIGSQVPVKLMHLEGLHELFVSKFVFSTLDLSMHLFKVHFRMKLTYKTLPYDDDEVQEVDVESTESGENPRGDIHNKTQWDDDCPWSEWYSAEDPVKGFDLITIWSEKTVESSLEMAELENASPHEAEKWFIFPNLSPNFTDGSVGNTIGFASQLHLLVNALDMSFEAQFMEDFVSVENSGSDNLKSSAVIPPPTVLDRVLKDLFHEGVQLLDFTEGEHKNSRAIKGAPLDSLFAQFCLHSLWFGNCNIRAIAVLWIEFVREVRWCWEESQPLPRMPTTGVIDLSTCLVNQKLHMLAICIEKNRQLTQKFQDGENEDHVSAQVEEAGQVNGDLSHTRMPSEDFVGKRDSGSMSDDSCHPETSVSRINSEAQDVVTSSDLRPSDCIRKGSAGVVGMMLLKSDHNLHVPFTQDAPLMTEDMHEERLNAVEALGSSFNFSAQLERDILSSDMSAFKAANPAAVFEDFIRWHSPRDWENDDFEESGEVSTNDAMEAVKNNWPPRGRLSERMSEHGNLWRKIWNDAPALPASEQKPLLDPNREGEKVLHYLETLRPYLLLEQMVCTAFRASVDTLNQATFGGLKQMVTKMGQLYLTMHLQANHLSVDSEITEDVKRLCVVFEHVEKLLTVAASLHRKFLQAPRLSEVIFSDYYDFYLPTMGTGAVAGNRDMVKLEEDIDQGVEYYKKALYYNWHYADAMYNLGVAYGEMLKFDMPIVFYELAFHFNPHCAEACNNLGVIYKDRDNLDKAVECYQLALSIKPNFSQSLNNLGVVYTVQGKMDAAASMIEKAIVANPTYAEAYNNLGVLYRDAGNITLAIESYEQCLKIDPDSRNAGQNRLLAMNYIHEGTDDKLFEAHRDWGRRFMRLYPQYTSWENPKDPERPLVIGYVSPDYFTHSVSYFIEAPLVYHDYANHKVVVYSAVVKADAKTNRFRDKVLKKGGIWRDIYGIDEKKVASMVREDKVDILIELTGHTANNKLGMMACRPAPVQVTWIGYPNTTGLPTIDYRITDALADSPDTRHKYVEELVRLPECFLCYTPSPEAGPVSPTPALSNGFITFGSFNNLAKITTKVLQVWARILCAVPNSRLVVKCKPFCSDSVRQRFLSTLEQLGLESQRVDLLPLILLNHDHMQSYALMDISLDTFPYAGTTTTCESLYMGVPCVTMGGSVHAHNVGVSLLSTVGLGHLVAKNEDEYVQLALKLASDVMALSNMRTGLRDLMSKSPLCDGSKFTLGLESTYRNMWKRFCKGDVPSLRRMEILQQQQIHQVSSEEPTVKISEPTKTATNSREGHLGSVKKNGFNLETHSILNLSTSEENGVVQLNQPNSGNLS